MTLHDALQTGRAFLADAYEDDAPAIVHGVAIPEDAVATGMADEPMYYPGDVLQEAEGMLAGKPLVEGHPGVEKTDDGLVVDPQPPVSSVIGEILEDAYEPGEGLLFKAELDDPDVAAAVENGRAEVSPIVGRDLGPLDEDRGARPATKVEAFRDVGVVTQGALPGNSIEPGAATAMSMSADALAAAFDATADDDGDGDGDVEASDERAESRAGDADADSVSDTGYDIMTDDELSDKQREILAQANQADDPTVVEADAVERLDEADALLEAADNVDADVTDVTVVAEENYDALSERVDALEGMLDERLTDEVGLKEGAVDAMSFEAKVAQFEDDDGEFDVDAFVQQPETGSGSEDADADDPDDDASGFDALSEDELSEASEYKDRIEYWDGKNDTIVEAEQDALADLVGADSFDDVDLEAI